MTKKEHAKLQEHFNQFTAHRDKADQAFKKLQDLNESEGTGCRWCSAKQNVMDLFNSGKDYMYLYDVYTKECAKIDELTDLGRVLADLNFWK